ncbi:MAG: DUF2935 domain-containing protein [Paraclostridium sp.]|uniref:DUF2935 domain-containing protein n=1 Tax=Paraclostridium sp. TaxID=2023273 RepID=UPI003F2F0827
MINDQKYVILSLELHLFFARIMKEHSLFLETGFMTKDSKLELEADHYKREFEKLLSYTVSASNGIIRPEVLESGEIFTNYTAGAEAKTQNLTGIDINQNITTLEAKLNSVKDPKVSLKLTDYIKELNSNAKVLLKGIISFKEKLLNGVLSCNLFTSNYPLLIEHMIREAKLYLSLVDNLENRVDIGSEKHKETELFWDQIMMEHALFMRGLLDPSESKLIETADEFAEDFEELLEKSIKMNDATIASVTDETLDKTMQLKKFKEAGVKGIASCKVRAIILPLLADHVLREANHYIRILESYKK